MINIIFILRRNTVIKIFKYNNFTRKMKIVGLLLILLTLLGWSSVEAKVPNPYKILGVSQSATDDQIKKAFKKRSLKYHPDRNT